MRIKATLVILSLLAFGAEAYGSGVNDVNSNTRSSYYYGPPPYEYGHPWAAYRYPGYLPREFGKKTETQKMMPWEYPVALEFVPYEYAQETYSDKNDTPPARETPPPRRDPEMEDANGFVPYEYAREKYSDY